MAKVLVVDDSPVDRLLVSKLLGKSLNLTAAYAANGREALDACAADPPDVVLTDLQMPEMDGLELVEQVRGRYPLVPLVLMTAHGSEEVAVQALKRGAASYVPKRNLAKELGHTLDKVLGLAHARRRQQRLRECLAWQESYFVLDNDRALIPPLVGELADNLLRLGLCDEAEAVRATVALGEALDNAMHHGNLEISAAVRDEDEKAYQDLIARRREQPPYRDRRVYVRVRESRDEAVCVIRDEGPGFDVARLPDPADPANMDHLENRGLLLIRTFMDEARYNAKGNEVTLVKRRRK